METTMALGHGNKTELEGLLGFGQGLGQGILEGSIHDLGYLRGLERIGQPDDIPAHLVGPGRGRLLYLFIQIIPMEKELGLIHCPLGPAIDTLLGQIPSFRER